MRKYMVSCFSVIVKLGVVCLLVFASCTTVQKTTVDEKIYTSEILQDDQYYTGDAGKGIRLAVVPIKKIGLLLSENELWFPEFIQGILTNDFTKFSKMEIIDRINLEMVLAEQELSMSGDYSDEDYIRIGNLTNAQYILTGSLVKISSVGFRLQLAIINTENGIRYKSYDQECVKTDIQSGTAIKRASEDLLRQMGVSLTEAGKITLRGTSVESDTSIARGLAARKKGNSIETLNYYYDAVAFDPSSIEAAERLSVIQEEIAENEEGAVLRNDIKSQTLWEKTLNDYTSFYSTHLPFELVFTQYAIQESADYSKKAYVLQMTAGLRWMNSVETMQNILDDINEGLEKSRRRDIWGFSNWPYNEALFTETKEITIVAEILGNDNEVLSSTTFSLRGRLGISGSRIFVDTEQSLSVQFPPVSYNDPNEIPDNFFVKVVSINQEDIERIVENGYIRIKPVSDFPKVQPLHSVFAEIENKRVAEETEKDRKLDEERKKLEYKTKWANARRTGFEALSLGWQWLHGSDALQAGSGQVGFISGLYWSPFLFTSVGLEWRANNAAFGSEEKVNESNYWAVSPNLGIVFPLGELIFLFSDALLEMGKFGEWNGLITNWAAPGFDIGITVLIFSLKYRGVWYKEGYANSVCLGIFIPLFYSN